MTRQDQTDVDKLTDEVLNLISVGAWSLAGGRPNDDWGKHTDDLLNPDEVFSEECATCRAVRWLDVAQAELRRRAASPEEPAAARQETGPLPLA